MADVGYQMGNENNVFEWRRFGHWDTSAEKTRFSAYLLWQMQDTCKLNEVVQQCGYTNGDAVLAVSEAFVRESAIALELIIKAVIARKLEARGADPATESVPANHDIPKLWSEANLPELTREDQYRLLLVKSVLKWSGRYATPRTVKAWEEENIAFDMLEDPPPEPGAYIFRTPITFEWSDFDRLYQMAKGAVLNKE